MRLLFLTIVILLSAGDLFAQRECPLTKDSLTNEMIVILPEQAAEVPGGLQVLSKAITSRVKFPGTDRATGLSGIYVAFIVDADGRIKGERIVRNTKPEVATQLFTAIKSLSWKPAKCNGKPVSSLFLLPLNICFKL